MLQQQGVPLAIKANSSVLEVFPKLYAFNFDISGYTIIKKFMLTRGNCKYIIV